MKSIRIVKVFWVFYKKLIIPSIILSFLLGLRGLIESETNSLASVGIAYMLITPIFHYLTYEIRNKNEYYFYFNQGLSKDVLWGLTFLFSFLIGLILITL